MSEIKKFRGEDYNCDNRDYIFETRDDGIRVFVDGKWWMPAKPFPPGFNQESAQFNTIENAVSAISAQFGIDYFLDMDENDHILNATTPAACAKELAGKPPRSRRRNRK